MTTGKGIKRKASMEEPLPVKKTSKQASKEPAEGKSTSKHSVMEQTEGGETLVAKKTDEQVTHVESEKTWVSKGRAWMVSLENFEKMTEQEDYGEESPFKIFDKTHKSTYTEVPIGCIGRYYNEPVLCNEEEFNKLKAGNLAAWSKKVPEIVRNGRSTIVISAVGKKVCLLPTLTL
jgi:hypothetical protein